jgi:microcystin-dependent protein
MSALDFPQSPTTGQIYEHPTAGAYEWTGYAWIRKVAAAEGVPQGAIIMWSGAESAIPSGWAICDGTNGTPNLRNRFILGSGVGANNPVGSTGGETSATLSVANMPAHAHGGAAALSGNISGTTSSTGGHDHSPLNPANGTCQNVTVAAGSTAYNVAAYGNTANGTYRTSSVGDHNHTFSGTISGGNVTIASEGSGESFKIMPPYYALAFIIKL